MIHNSFLNRYYVRESSGRSEPNLKEFITFDFLSGGVSRFVDLRCAISGSERTRPRPHILGGGGVVVSGTVDIDGAVASSQFAIAIPTTKLKQVRIPIYM